MKKFEVVVVGYGSMGVSTAAYLSRAGISVLVIDPFQAPHLMGSHSGVTRAIRQSYFEHPDYVPLVLRSYELWKELELASGFQIYHQTGLLYMGEQSSKVLQGVKYSSDKYNLPLKSSTQNWFTISSEWQVWMEEEAGYLDVEKSFEGFKKYSGPNYITFANEKVISWEQGSNSIQIDTNKNKYECEKLIFTAGAFNNGLLRNYSLPLTVTKQSISWLTIEEGTKYDEGDFPCWFIHDIHKGMYYGFPQNHLIKPGLKFGLHIPGEIINPDEQNQSVSQKDKDDILEGIQKYLPDLKVKSIEYQSCMYTYTPDENFIIDYLPETNEKVIVAAGFSGHGFKFVPVVGEILRNMVMESNKKFNIDLFSLDRFKM